MYSAQDSDYLDFSVNDQHQVDERINTHQLAYTNKLSYKNTDLSEITNQNKKVKIKYMILDKLESLIISIKGDRKNTGKKENKLVNYKVLREEIFKEFQHIIHCAVEVYTQLGFSLFKDKHLASEELYDEEEETQDLIKIRILVIAKKFKELDKYIANEHEHLLISKNKSATLSLTNGFVDDDLQDAIEKFQLYLRSTKLNWETNSLPQNIDEATYSIKDHQEVLNNLLMYWKNIQILSESKVFHSYMDKENKEKLLYKVAVEKIKWDNDWNSYLNNTLNPLYSLLLKLEAYSNDLNEDITKLVNLLEEPNHTLELVNFLKNELLQLQSRVEIKKETLETLSAEASNIHKTDFNDLFSSIYAKFGEYKEGLGHFLQVENTVEEILEYLPKLLKFKEDLQNKRHIYENNPIKMNELIEDAETMKTQIVTFDIGNLRKVALKAYGNTKRVENIIDELKTNFDLLSCFQINEEVIVPKCNVIKEKFNFEIKDTSTTMPLKEFNKMTNYYSERFVYLEMSSLPKDQYNIQWYKAGVVINPREDLSVLMEYKGSINITSEAFMFSDVRKYCEVQNVQSHQDLNTIPPKKNTHFNMNPPSFILTLLKEVICNNEESVIMKCKVSGKPFPIVKWFKDGYRIQQSDLLKINHIDDMHEIHITNTRLSDSGTYEVVASNNLGSESSQCFVSIVSVKDGPECKTLVSNLVQINNQIPDQINDTTVIAQRKDLLLVNSPELLPPKFLNLFSDTTFHVGDDIILKCSLVGQPEPKVWWGYNSQLLRNPRCEMTHYLNDYCLMIRDVKEEDTGRYSMNAENSGGIATCSASVIVNLGERTVCPDVEEGEDIDYSKTKLTTVKTYHYSGPGGIDLPGIGFIPKSTYFPSTSSTNNENDIYHAVIVPNPNDLTSQIESKTFHENRSDTERFSYAESSECEYS